MTILRIALPVASLLASVAVLGCARAKVTQIPDGGHRIVCERGMKICVARAEKLCGDDGYTILSGGTRMKLLGGSSSSYQQMSENGELVVMCGEALAPVAEEKAPIALPPRSDEPTPAASPAAACVPGSTQQCVGPGACAGGQTCLADGRGYGACDCGGSSRPDAGAPPAPRLQSPAAAPAAPPTTPAGAPEPEPLGPAAAP